jgi:hypothetical protein
MMTGLLMKGSVLYLEISLWGYLEKEEGTLKAVGREE